MVDLYRYKPAPDPLHLKCNITRALLPQILATSLAEPTFRAEHILSARPQL